MIDKKQYQRTFGVLHASGDFLKEDLTMNKPKPFPVRRALALCAAMILIFCMATVCYAADVGGIRRTIQIWIHGDQTTAVMDIQNGGYTLRYEDADGTPHEQSGGGVAINPDGSERPMTDEEILERVMENARMPDIEYRDDGTVWVYYMDQAMEITDRFDADGVCFLQLKDGADTLYLTVEYQKGHAISSSGFIQPEEFN